MKIKCDECGNEFDFDKSQIQEMWVKRPRRANDLINISFDSLVLGHGYELVHFVNCDCGNRVFIEGKMTEQEKRERLDNGLCIKCGKPIQDKRGICQECYDSLSQTDKTYIRLLWETFRIVGNNNDGN